MASKKAVPTRGRIVNYVSAGTAQGAGPEGTEWAAIVIRPVGEPHPHQCVNLWVLTDNGGILAREVPHSDDKAAHSWDWLAPAATMAVPDDDKED